MSSFVLPEATVAEATLDSSFDCEVAAGELLVVVEAMKMEHSIRAAEAGEVTAIHCAEGDLVEEGRVLVALQPLAEEATA